MEKWNAIKEEIKPEVGDFVEVSSWSGPGAVRLDESDWELADFRIKTVNTGINIAVNVTVTGRTYQWPFGFGSPRAVRVKIEFVGSDSTTRGWLIKKEDQS